jgi:hypothetical protein
MTEIKLPSTKHLSLSVCTGHLYEYIDQLYRGVVRILTCRVINTIVITGIRLFC